MGVGPMLECILLEKYTVAPAPSRDYYGIKVSPSVVQMYHWKVSRYQTLFPTVQCFELDRFTNNSSIQEEVEYIFGKEILLNILDAAHGKCDFLSVLPPPILTHILSLISLNDIAAVAVTCKRLSNMVSTNDELWKELYSKHFQGKILTKEEKNEVRFWGWKRFFKNNLNGNKKITRLTPFSLMHDRKAKKSAVYQKSNLQKETPNSARSSPTNSQVIWNIEHRKNTKLSSHETRDERTVVHNKFKSTTMTGLLPVKPAPHILTQEQSKTSKSVSNKNRNANIYKESITSSNLFKHLPSSLSTNKQDVVTFPQTIKLNTAKNSVKPLKLNKLR